MLFSGTFLLKLGKSIYKKLKSLIALVQEMGLEPTRETSLEPETSASAIPPFLHILILYAFFQEMLNILR